VQADSLLSKLAWYAPEDRTLLSIRMQAALKRGDVVGAARLLARVPSSDVDASEIRLQQARLLIQAFCPRDAETALRECLTLEPGNDSARMTLIAIFALQHRARDYEREAWRLFDQGGEPIKALRLLAQAAPTIPPDTFTRTADIGDVLRQCLAADPDDPYTQLALGRFERERGAIDEALRLIEPCLKIATIYSDASIEWAMCLLDEGALDELHPYFEQPAESVRNLASFRFLRGEWSRRQGRIAQAIDDYRQAIRLDPRLAEAHYRLGLSLPKTDPEAARLLEIPRKARELKDAVTDVSDSSRDSSQLARIGRLCAEIGRLREASAWLTLALKYDPNEVAIRESLKAVEASQPIPDRQD
jgi:tetratricopeptide (TPR) repeat protein